MHYLLTAFLLAAPARADIAPDPAEEDTCGCSLVGAEAGPFGLVAGALAVLVVGARRRP